MLDVIALEVPIMGLMEIDDDGHDLAHTQFALAQALLAAIAEQAFLPFGQEDLAEIIYIDEQFE
jgi:hypothetical protein